MDDEVGMFEQMWELHLKDVRKGRDEPGEREELDAWYDSLVERGLITPIKPEPEPVCICKCHKKDKFPEIVFGDPEDGIGFKW